MGLPFYIALPPTLLTLTVLWVAGGFWCERRFTFPNSLIRQGIAFVAFVLWMIGFTTGIGLFLASLAALFAKLFVPGA